MEECDKARKNVIYEPWLVRIGKVTAEEARGILITKGENPDNPPRGVAFGMPPPNLRNHICEVDGHSDPDNSGICIYCSFDLELDYGRNY